MLCLDELWNGKLRGHAMMEVTMSRGWRLRRRSSLCFLRARRPHQLTSVRSSLRAGSCRQRDLFYNPRSTHKMYVLTIRFPPESRSLQVCIVGLSQARYLGRHFPVEMAEGRLGSRLSSAARMTL